MKRTAEPGAGDKHRPVAQVFSLDKLCITRQGFLCREAAADLKAPSAAWKQSSPLSSTSNSL